jgi:hypothetical protein
MSKEKTILKHIHFSVEVIQALKLLGIDFDINTDILLSYDSLEHASEHKDIEGHLSKIADIVENPQYIGYRPSDNSIELARKYKQGTMCIIVPVRPSSDGLFFIRTSHRINTLRFDKYVKNGKFIDLTKT